jgi:hypothetical protein
MENRTTIDIICTGSNNLPEWLSNLRFIPWNGFHAGFNHRAKKFFKQLKSYNFGKKRIRVICHSRGIYGAIVGKLLKDNNIVETVGIISFGAPEFMSDRGAKKFSLDHTRVELEHDIVTGMVPFLKYFETEYHLLANVKGKFDHTSYGDALRRDLYGSD